MKLYRQDIQNWNNIPQDGIPDFIFSDVPVSGYIEFDSIEDINIALGDENSYVKKVNIEGVTYYCDYKFGRDHLKTKYTGVWNNHTTTEQYIFCKHKIGDKEDRINCFDFETIEKLTMLYSYRATHISRKLRSTFVYNEVYNRISDDDAKQIGKEAQSPFLRYKELGLDGIINGDPASINDYIHGTTGTEYETVNLKSKNISNIEGFTNIDDFCDYLTNILIHGKYMSYKLAEILNLV